MKSSVIFIPLFLCVVFLFARKDAFGFNFHSANERSAPLLIETYNERLLASTMSKSKSLETSLAYLLQDVVKGRVVDENDTPLVGVSIKLKGTSHSILTDENGNYEIKANLGSLLELSYVGYTSQTIEVRDNAIIESVLEKDVFGLDEVVVIGYGTVKKKDLTGAVGSVNGQELANRKTSQLSSSLQGTVAGLMVRRDNSAPGAGTSSIHIRGVTTIGDSSPLIIVDGVPGSLDQVNPNDVESVTVLKDAASASIYGSRAAAGVILVTTKRGNRSELTLTYNGELGFEKPTSLPEVVGVSRYLEMSNELRYNDNADGGMYQAFSQDQVENWLNYNLTDPNQYPVTDWTDLILKGSAPRQTHSLHLSGGNEFVRTKASLAYDNVDGLYADRNFNRYTMRVNNDFSISDILGATLDFNVKRSKHHSPIYSPFSTTRMMPAIYAAMWDDGRIAEGKSGENPYGLLQEGGGEDKWYTQVGGKASLDIKPFKGFVLSAVVAPIINFDKAKSFKRKASYTLANDPNIFGGWLEDAGNPYTTNKLTEARNDNYNVTSQLIANYMRSFDRHSFTLMGGFENYYEKHENLGASRDHYILTQYPYLNTGPTDYRDNNGEANEYTYNSFFGRLMYSFQDKYLFQANLRYDGSSRFSKHYRWGSFPSFSGAWIASEESFIKDSNLTWLSFLKVRASWGNIGNERIGSNYFPYMALMNFNNALFYQNGELISANTASQRTFAVEDITWETTTSTNLGLDVSVLNNRLRLVADYYWKSTKDMLLDTKIPAIMGYGNPSTNAGRMSTTGFDLELGWNDKKGDWSYGISANLSDFISKIDDLKNSKLIGGDKIKMTGVGFNEWYGYKSNGIYQNQAAVDNSAKLNNQVKVGDLEYLDISGPDGVPDGIISPEYDRVPLGNSLPRFQFGGTLFLAYKSFDISLAFNGIAKQNVRLERAMVEVLSKNFGNPPAVVDGNYWSSFKTDSENAQARYPRLTTANREGNMAMSDFWMFNGRYFRLKNITLGYVLPSELTQRAKIKKMRVFATATDLFSLSKYPHGWDPEMGVSAYPITTSWIFGMSLNF